jgi:hypothetical protein
VEETDISEPRKTLFPANGCFDVWSKLFLANFKVHADFVVQNEVAGTFFD